MKTTIDMAREAGFQTGKRDYADGHGAYPFVVSVSTGNFLVELKAFEIMVRKNQIQQDAHLADELWRKGKWEMSAKRVADLLREKAQFVEINMAQAAIEKTTEFKLKEKNT